jgi:phenylacetate-CoA ligase
MVATSVVVYIPVAVSAASLSSRSLGRRARNIAYAGALSQLEHRVPFWPLERTLRLQRRRIRAVVKHAYETVPFYCREMDTRGLRPEDFSTAEDLTRLPLISAADLVRSSEDFISASYRENDREVFLTSGSTSGLRKPIYLDHGYLVRRIGRSQRDRVVVCALADESWMATIARELLDDRLPRVLHPLLRRLTESHNRLSIFPADFSSRTERAMWNEQSLVPRRAVHRQHMSPHAGFEEVLQRLEELRPRVVLSFGSYVEHFMRALDASGATVPLPRVWVYMGDMVSDYARRLAEQRFGVALCSVYGAMEAGSIGFQCEQRQGFHLNIDLCALRLVNDEGRTLGPGEPGEVVVSPLDNRAMVLLNYRLGDRAVLQADPCPCGRTLPVLAALEGRRSEVISLPSGRELSTLNLESAFAAELGQTLQAQVEQTGAATLCWRMVPVDHVDRDALRQAFVIRAARELGADVELSIEFVDEIALTAQGKFRRVVAGSA